MDAKTRIIASSKKFLLAIKSSGQLSQKSERGDESLQNLLEAYQKKSLHILTRLDRPVSGLVLFSRSSDFTAHYLKEQAAGRVTKTYLALVEGVWDSKLTELSHYHYHDKKHKKARLTTDPMPGKSVSEVSLDCKLVKALDRYSLLEISLKKGRFHQIRAQLAEVGFPIKGDVKYGARRGNKDRSIHLHAYSIQFKELNAGMVHYEITPPVTDSLWKAATEATQ
jgi:23S rRNA pseudouridine1911/1915/1917 synthase